MAYESIERIKIKLAYLKGVVQFVMVTVGGMLAIAKAYFQDSKYDLVLWGAVALSVVAAIMVMTIAEGIIRRISTPPTWRWLAVVAGMIPQGSNSDCIRSALSGLLIVASWALFGAYVWLSR